MIIKVLYPLQAAKDVVLAEKPVIGDDSNQLDPSLLDELLANIATLSSVYHKPPEAFVTRVKTVQRTDEEEYPDGSERGTSDSPAYAANSGGVSPPVTAANAQYAAGGRQQAVVPVSPAPVPDLLDLMGMDGNNSATVSADQPTTPAGYVLDFPFSTLCIIGVCHLSKILFLRCAFGW